MALMNRGKTKKLVLDIGTSAIRLCELALTKSGYQLVKYHQRDVVLDPALEEEEKTVRRREALEGLLKEAKVRNKRTVVAVPGQSVFTRNRPLPPVPEHKVTQIVKYEIQQQIPFSLDQIALDYQVLDRTESGGYDVMMAAIKVDVVEKHIEVLEKTKRVIDTVDVSPLAAYNWLLHTGEFGDDGQSVAMLDLGATTTDIVIRKDNQFRFTRSLHVGGNDVTRALASAFSMSFEQAEAVKRERGFAPTGNAQRDGKGGEVIGNVLTRLVGEITRSFSYFRSQPGGGPVSRIVVTGGGACLRNIVPYLQSQLGVEVRIAQPLASLAIGPGAKEASEHPEQACVALGLALRCVETVPIQINLIPPRVLEAARRKEQAFYWVLSLVTVFLIIASIIPVTAAKDDATQGHIRLLTTILTEYDPALVPVSSTRSEYEDSLQNVKSTVSKHQGAVKSLDDLHINRKFWLNYFQIIDEARPVGGAVTISSIETAVIGGEGNTGAAARGGGAAAGEPAATTPGAPATGVAPPAGGAVTPGATAATGRPSRFGRPGRGRPPRGPGSRARGATQAAAAPTTYQAIGFPGLGIGASARLGGPAGRPGGRPRGGPGGGGRPRRGGPGANAQIEQKIIEPNGFIIYGYAKDIESVERFKTALEEKKDSGQPVFVENGVYLHIALTDKVFEQELDNARVSSASTGVLRGGGGRFGRAGGSAGGPRGASLGGSRGGRPGSARGGRFGRRGGLGSRTGFGAGFQTQYAGAEITRFRIDVQFLGKAQPQPEGSMATLRGGRGMRGAGRPGRGPRGRM